MHHTVQCSIKKYSPPGPVFPQYVLYHTVQSFIQTYSPPGPELIFLDIAVARTRRETKKRHPRSTYGKRFSHHGKNSKPKKNRLSQGLYCLTIQPLEGVRSVQTLVRGVFSIQKREGGNPRNSEVYKACTAENVRKIGVKSTVLELQKTYRYKSSSIINFQNIETG